MSIITQDALEQEIKSASFRPVYTLLGPEEYLRNQALSLLKRSVLVPEAFGFNYSQYSLKTATLKEVLISAQTFPFASPRRLVVATQLESLPASDHDELFAYMDRPLQKTVLVLDADDLDRRMIFYRSIRDKCAIIEFPRLKGAALERWAERHIRREGYKIAPVALNKLVAMAGSDLMSLAGEIEKLILFAGKEKTIPDAAVDNLVQVSRQHGIFELTKAIGKKDRVQALQLLANLLESGESAIGILAMIARHFRQILIAKELLADGRSAADLASALQIPPYVIEEHIRQARAFDTESARRIYLRLADLDHRMKSSRGDPRLILENLICSL